MGPKQKSKPKKVSKKKVEDNSEDFADEIDVCKSSRNPLSNYSYFQLIIREGK
jgi:hypothetical protein